MDRFQRIVLLGVVFPALAFCQKVSLAFDEQQDFSGYKTFALVSGKLNSKNPALNNELVQKQLDQEIRRRLTERGLTEVTAQPDLNVRYTLGSSRQVENEAYPAGWYPTRVVRVRYTEGTFILDLRDAKKHTLVWRAISVADDHDALKIKDRLPDMVKKAVDKYPPKK